jgi:outer membrane protein assembly factor BamB
MVVGSGVPDPDSIQQEQQAQRSYNEVNTNNEQNNDSTTTTNATNNPVSLKDHLFVSFNGYLRAINIRTGQDSWVHDDNAALFSNTFFLSCIFLEDHKIYLAGGSSGTSKHLWCFDASSGKVVWQTMGRIHGGFAFMGSLKWGYGETNRSGGYVTLVQKVMDERRHDRDHEDQMRRMQNSNNAFLFS